MSKPKTKPAYPLKGVTDATEPFDFIVEWADAKGSVVADPKNCAGACALRRHPDVVDAHVSAARVYLTLADGRILRYDAPESVVEAVRNFDKTAGLFPPGQYTLKVLPPTQRQGSKRRGKHTKDGTRPHLAKKREAKSLR